MDESNTDILTAHGSLRDTDQIEIGQFLKVD